MDCLGFTVCNQIEAITSNFEYCLSIHYMQHIVKYVVGVSLGAVKGWFFTEHGLLHEGKRRATGVSELRWGQGGRDLTFNHWVWTSA